MLIFFSYFASIICEPVSLRWFVCQSCFVSIYCCCLHSIIEQGCMIYLLTVWFKDDSSYKLWCEQDLPSVLGSICSYPVSALAEASGPLSGPRLCMLIFVLVIFATDQDLTTNYVFMHDQYCVCLNVYFGALTIVYIDLCLLTLY